MRIYMFKSESKHGLQAFAADSSGNTLPKQFAPWSATGVVAEGRAPPHGMSRDTIEQGIEAHGFQMWRMKAAPAST
jgi:hypothetical protein